MKKFNRSANFERRHISKLHLYYLKEGRSRTRLAGSPPTTEEGQTGQSYKASLGPWSSEVGAVSVREVGKKSQIYLSRENSSEHGICISWVS